MIEGYVGLIGGGKSLSATDRMMRYMAGGGVVYTNMTLVRNPWYNLRYSHCMREFKLSSPPAYGVVRVIGGQYYYFDGELCLCRIEKGRCYANSCGFEDYLKRTYKWQYQEGQYNKLSNEDLTGELHALIPRGTPSKPVLCVLDEAVDFFDTDDRGKANREFLSFLRHSRKQAVDMIFIAQDFQEVNKRIRNQTQFIWTFWDMQTFKIPGLRTTLPPPWKNMILCQQWNRNMSGGVLKRVWKTRDTGLFGCYRTDELFRALKSADGKTDFSGEGNIKPKGKKMNVFERAALFFCVLFSALSFFGKGNVPQTANASETSSKGEVVKASIVTPGTVTVLYGRFQVADVPSNNFFSLRVDGVDYRVGSMTSAGTVLSVTAQGVHIRDNKGNDTFIYPRRDYFMQDESKLLKSEKKGQVNETNVAAY